MNTIEFMNEVQKEILKKVMQSGLFVVGLIGFSWYQTDRIEKQEAKFEVKQVEQDKKITTLQNGLYDCNAERAALKVQVDNLSFFVKRKIK